MSIILIIRHISPDGKFSWWIPCLIFSLIEIYELYISCSQVVQCTMYDKGQQVISSVAKFILYTIGVFVFVSGVICITSYLSLLDFLYFLSMVKLFITLIKYIPQVNIYFSKWLCCWRKQWIEAHQWIDNS